MAKKTKGRKGRVPALAEVLGGSEAWAGSILGRLGVEVSLSGEFDDAAARSVLEVISSQYAPGARGNPFTSAEMGPTEESCRRWLIARLEQQGLQLVGRAKRRGFRMTVKRPDDSEFFLFTLVSLRTKANGQIGFTVNHLDDPELDIIVFIAKPWGKAFLRRRKEILEHMRIQPGDEPKSAGVTFSPGSDVDLFENRVKELLSAD